MPDWYNAPPTLLAAIFIIIGFYALIKGADWLVEGGVQIAKRFDLTPAVIGATIVAFGTSLPELVVSLGSNIKAVAEGSTGPEGPAAIAIGNVVGSNIFNVGAILGIAALIRPLPVPRSTLRLDYPLMIAALVLMVVFSLPWNGGPAIISRMEGGILFLCLIAFTVMAVRTGRVAVEEVEALEQHQVSPWGAVVLVIGGILLLMVGGEVSLTGALKISRDLHLTERVIGLTVMALGTSLPELATSVQAVRKGHADVALGNVVGSNLFNVFCIVGTASLVLPLPVNRGNFTWDYWWMLGICLLLLPFLLTGRRLSRWEGGLLLMLLVSYVTLVLAMPGLAGG